MEVVECIPCQYGQHDSCQGRRPPPEGMIGGTECPCEGDCAERNPPPVATENTPDRWTVLVSGDAVIGGAKEPFPVYLSQSVLPHEQKRMCEVSELEKQEPRPGELHPVDQAFYDLTVRERDFQRTKVDRLVTQLADLRLKLEEALRERDEARAKVDQQGHNLEEMMRLRAELDGLRRHSEESK